MKIFSHSLLAFLLAACGAAQAFSAVVYLPGDPASAEKEAAEELAHYWEKLTGDPVVIQPEPRRTQVRPRYHRFGGWRPMSGRETNELAFYVGETEASRVYAPLPAGIDKDGFVLHRRGNQLFLRGRSAPATRSAVYRFLGRYGGIRWYMPTELGEHVPDFRADTLPRRIDDVEEPDFLSRQWSGATQSKGDLWEVRNGMRRRDHFHHNLHRLFTEAVYDLRPDFFMMRGGKRIRPDDALGGHNLQICFGNPDAAKFAARKAAQYFDENPGAPSFSLGMNDTAPICQCPDCQRWVDPEKTFRDRPDYSDLLFVFMNRAAEELSKTHPDKYLGCLAYHWAENVPSFPVYPKVMPYLTADRGQWHSEGFRLEDRDLMRRWAKAGPERIGIYDYYYGSSFVIPRLFTALTKESLQHAREVGIDGFYAELYSTWSLDGPKAWLTSQLLWDVAADREELLEEYYRNFFGGAAEPMRLFYERCEEIWMNQGEPVSWLKFYHDFTQLELFPPRVCMQLRRLLEDAGKLAATDLARERVALVSQGFRLTELYSQLYHGIKEGAAEADELNGEFSGDPLDVLVSLIERSIADKKALERHYREVIMPNELHRPSRRIEERAGFLPGMKLDGLIEHAAALSEGERTQAELARLVDEVAGVFPESQADVVLKHPRINGPEVLRNVGFEDDATLIGADYVVHDPAYTPFFWKRETGDGTAPAFLLSDAEFWQGALSLSARGAVSEDLFQRFSATAGQVYRFSVWSKGRVSPGSEVEIRLSWRDAHGNNLPSECQNLDRFLPGSSEDWQELLVFGTAPPEAVQGFAILTVRNQAPDDFVYFDEVSLRLAEPMSR